MAADKRIDTKINSIESGIAEIKEQLSTIIKKQNKAENKCKEQAGKIDRIEEICNEYMILKEELEELKSENVILKRKISEIQMYCTKLKKEELKNKIEIYGIPQTEMENLNQLVIELAKEAKVELQLSEIEECYRPKATGNIDKQIIVKFKGQEKKSKILKAMKGLKPRLKNLKMQPENKKIFVNEALTYETKKLLYQTKLEARTKEWYKIWIYAGDVYIKLEEKGKEIKIQDEESLITLLKV